MIVFLIKHCAMQMKTVKREQTPFEFYGSDEANWSAIKRKSLKIIF